MSGVGKISAAKATTSTAKEFIEAEVKMGRMVLEDLKREIIENLGEDKFRKILPNRIFFRKKQSKKIPEEFINTVYSCVKKRFPQSRITSKSPLIKQLTRCVIDDYAVKAISAKSIGLPRALDIRIQKELAQKVCHIMQQIDPQRMSKHAKQVIKALVEISHPEGAGKGAGAAIRKASGGAKLVGRKAAEEGLEGLGKAWRTVRKFGQEVFEFVVKRAH